MILLTICPPKAFELTLDGISKLRTSNPMITPTAAVTPADNPFCLLGLDRRGHALVAIDLRKDDGSKRNPQGAGNDEPVAS